MSDAFDIAGTAEQEATAASAKYNYGKLKITPRFIQWKDKQPTEIDAATYTALDARSRSLEYVFGVDIQEFKPDLQFTYDRKVQVGGPDWNKTLKPSIEAVAGKGSTDKDALAATLRSLNGSYVCAEDVPQIPTPKNPNRANFNTIKIITVYPTREACFAAWQERYGGEAASGGTPANDTPAGYTPEAWAKQAPDLKTLRAKYIAGGKKPTEATDAAAEEYGATGAQVAKLLGIEYTPELIPA